MSTPSQRSVGEPLSVRRPFWEAARPGRKTALRAPRLPSPFPAPRPRRGCKPGSGVPRAPHLFQRRHQQPPPLGCVLLAEKLVRQLLRLHGAPGAPLGGERGGGRAGEPREGELAAPNRAAAPTGRPGPLGAPRGRASLGEGAEGRGPRPATHPTRVPAVDSERSPQAAAAASRTTTPGPGPPPLPGPPAPPRAALRRGRRPPGLRSRARPGPAAQPAAGGRACGGTLLLRRPLRAAGTPKRERPGAERGRGVAGEGKGPRSSLEYLAGQRCRRGRRRRRCSARASY